MTVLAAVAPAGTDPRSCEPMTSSVVPASRWASVSPRQITATRPAAWAASALARTTASVSPWSARRSEWPRMTWLAPASFSMAAAMSPVWAPEASGWQSWPPTITGPPFAFHAIWAMSVAGGQIRTSDRGAGWALASASTSARLAASPFIFQLPAASFRRIRSSLRSSRATPRGRDRRRGRGRQGRQGAAASRAWRSVSAPGGHRSSAPTLRRRCARRTRPRPSARANRRNGEGRRSRRRGRGRARPSSCAWKGTRAPRRVPARMRLRPPRRSSPRAVDRGVLELDRFAAAAGFGHVGVVEAEARFQQRGLVVDLGPEKEHLRHRRDHHPRAILFHDLVHGPGRGGEFHGVLHARAAALLDAEPQPERAVLRHQAADLRHRARGEGDRALAGYAEHVASPFPDA